jgi:putative toxin-antitoxin system antitoxin component (TIGR02293 family)
MGANTLTDVLGVHPKGQVQPTSLMTEVERGLPLSALDRLARAVAPDDTEFPNRIVPRALPSSRNAPAARLSAEESARLARLAEVWALAREVWGSEDAARAFLFRPHPMLEGREPIDVVLANEFGRPLVEGILGGLQYGSAV